MTTAASKKIRASVKELYLVIEKEFTHLIKESKTKAQRNKIIALHSSARDAYWKGVSERLEDNNIIVKELHADLKEITKKIQDDLKTISDISKSINILTEAVRLAGSIVALAAV